MTSSERCLVCGAALRDDSPFCVSCGMPRPAAPPAASEVAPASSALASTPAAALAEATPEPEAPVAVEAAAEPIAEATPEPVAEEPAAAFVQETPAAAAPEPTPEPVAAPPAPVAHAAAPAAPPAPAFKLTGGRAALGPFVLLIALAILVAVIIWIQAGYPLPAGWGQ